MAQTTARIAAYIGDENASCAPAFPQGKGARDDTQNGVLVRDEIGIDCNDFQDIFAQATSGLVDFAQDTVPGAKWPEMAVSVRDDRGHTVMQAILRLEIRKSG